MKQFYQCRLRRGNSEQTAWIEARGAKRGVTVELLPSREKWKVIEVFKLNMMPEDSLKAKQIQDRKGLPSVERGWRDRK